MEELVEEKGEIEEREGCDEGEDDELGTFVGDFESLLEDVEKFEFFFQDEGLGLIHLHVS